MNNFDFDSHHTRAPGPQRVSQRLTRLLVGLAVLLATVSPAFAGSSKNSVIMVSPELMLALEDWSTPNASLESVTRDGFAQAIKQYALAVDDLYASEGGLGKHLEANYPATILEYLEDGGDLEDLPSLVAHFMTDLDAYAAWQKERLLTQNKSTFPKYVDREFPEINDAVKEATTTPASRNISFVDFVAERPGDSLASQANNLLLQVDAIPFAPDFDCVCWVALAFTRAPSTWEHQLPSPEHTFTRWAIFKERQVDYEAEANGAVSDVDFYRMSKDNRFEERRRRASTRTSMRARMHCTRRGEPGGQICQGAGCSADFATRIEYGSRVFEEIDSRGFFGSSSKSLASDYAELTHESTSSPLETLFRKGVSVAGNTQTRWDPEALGQILSGVSSVVQVIAGVDGTSVANLLSGDLFTDTIEGIFGLIVHEGQPGSLDESMRVAFDTVNHQITLEPNETHTFDLTTESEVYGYGSGARSESWATIQSYNSLGAVVRNFQCTIASPPPPGACWYFETAGAPHSEATLRSNMGDYIFTELGVRPTDSELDAFNGLCP